MGTKIVLIANPVAGKGAAARVAKAVRIIEARGRTVRLLLTGRKGDAERFAREIRAAAHFPGAETMVVAAGGDGTCNEVANGLALSAVPMAILPFGTTNVLAREMGIPFDPDKAVETALSGSAQSVSLGRITVESPRPVVRYFLLMAGIGFDGETVFRVGGMMKRCAGKGAYIWSGLRTLLSWNPERMRAIVDGETHAPCSVIVCNAARYAGDFRLLPAADLRRPSLQAVLMTGPNRRDMIGYARAAIAERICAQAGVCCREAKKIDIAGDAHIQVDGDYLGRGPAWIEIVPDALKLVF